MKPRAPRFAFNTTSMIDVIFILLIFFIAVSRLKEGKLSLQLPQARSDTPGRVADEPGQLTIALDRENRVLVDRVACETEGAMTAAIRSHRERHGAESPVLFVADRESHSGALVSALKIVTDEGYRNISFSYEPRREGR